MICGLVDYTLTRETFGDEVAPEVVNKGSDKGNAAKGSDKGKSAAKSADGKGSNSSKGADGKGSKSSKGADGKATGSTAAIGKGNDKGTEKGHNKRPFDELVRVAVNAAQRAEQASRRAALVATKAAAAYDEEAQNFHVVQTSLKALLPDL